MRVSRAMLIIKSMFKINAAIRALYFEPTAIPMHKQQIKNHLIFLYSELRQFKNAIMLAVIKNVIPKSTYADVDNQITIGVVIKMTMPSNPQLRPNLSLR